MIDAIDDYFRFDSVDLLLRSNDRTARRQIRQRLTGFQVGGPGRQTVPVVPAQGPRRRARRVGNVV